MEWLENHPILLWHRRTQLDQVYSPNYEWSHNTNRCVLCQTQWWSSRYLLPDNCGSHSLIKAAGNTTRGGLSGTEGSFLGEWTKREESAAAQTVCSRTLCQFIRIMGNPCQGEFSWFFSSLTREICNTSQFWGKCVKDFMCHQPRIADDTTE